MTIKNQKKPREHKYYAKHSNVTSFQTSIPLTTTSPLLPTPKQERRKKRKQLG